MLKKYAIVFEHLVSLCQLRDILNVKTLLLSKSMFSPCSEYMICTYLGTTTQLLI